jgi:GntR family transcriptional regulator
MEQVLSEARQPRYSVVARSIADEIRRGTLHPGDRLPSERELGRRLRASRVTIRRALAHLRAEGLIESSGNRGWFLTKTSVGEPNALVGFTEMAADRGLVATSRVVSKRTRTADVDEANALLVAPGTGLFELERVRLLDSIPVGVDHSLIILGRAPSLPHRDFASESLYAALESDGVYAIRAEYVIQAATTDARLARLLDVAEGLPILVTHATTYDQSGRPVELSHTTFLGDRYRLQTTLYRASRFPPFAKPGQRT